MAKRLDPRYLTILLRLQKVPPNINSYITRKTYPHNTTILTTIRQAYSIINDKIAKELPITPESLNQDLPQLPKKIIQELTKCTQKINEYHPATTTTHNYDTPQNHTRPNNPPTQTLKIITWNTGCINSSLPGIQELTRTLHPNLHIILIQETKIPKTKSTSYIDRLLPNYKIIYNNSNNTTQKRNRYTGPNQARGAILAMIPISIYTNDNIIKIPTSSTISSYLQAIMINNKPITPIIVLNMYMPSHLEDAHLIPEIQNQIHNIILQHPNHTTILAGDFNRDILLQGRTNQDLTTPPTMEDNEWAQFTHNNGLKVITNPINFTCQGGHNYTSTSHIDGFYTNAPKASNLQSHTITTLNQNYDHYPVQLQLAPNTIIIKETITPTNIPRITYPISPNNLQNLQTTFMEKQNLEIANLTQILQQEHLTLTQWEDAQHKLQEIINSLNQCIEQTCMSQPAPPLSNKVKSQARFLPRTQQKNGSTN
jgi:exonuclease III